MRVCTCACTHARPLSEVEGQELLFSSSVFLETLEMAKVLKGCYGPCVLNCPNFHTIGQNSKEKVGSIKSCSLCFEKSIKVILPFGEKTLECYYSNPSVSSFSVLCITNSCDPQRELKISVMKNFLFSPASDIVVTLTCVECGKFHGKQNRIVHKRKTQILVKRKKIF